MFLDQTFAFSDLFRVFVLAFIELLLSADNAIVLALISYSLPVHLRRKALYIGVISSFFLRALGLLGIAFLLKYIWIQILGGAYLLYLSIAHFIKKKKQPEAPRVHRSFWNAVILIELFDLAFAIDSIVAGVAFIGTTPYTTLFHPKLWIVYLGGMLGLIGTRYAADLFSSLIDRFPKLETSAYLLIGWIGIDLILASIHWTFPGFELVFWAGMLLLFLWGLISRRK